MARKRRKPSRKEDWQLFHAEAQYADAMLRSALGDSQGAIESLQRALDFMPTYGPAILSMGSVEYQRGRTAEGRKLFLSLLALGDDTSDLSEIIDEAGSFLIQIQEYADGLELYRQAAARFPDVALIHQGLGCCAGHQSLHEEALTASQCALELEPEKQEFVSDLGWTLVLAGRLDEAKKTLERAVAMDPDDDLARENLRYCNSMILGNEEAS